MFVQWSNILNFLIYLGVTLPLLGMGIVVFLITTPYREFRLIRDGANTTDSHGMAAAKAAAHDLGGKILGLSIVLASAVFHSLHLWDLILWGVIGILFQVLVFYLFELLTPFKVVSEIPKGNVSVAICFGAFDGCADQLLIAECESTGA